MVTFLTGIAFSTFSQRFSDQVPQLKRYNKAEVLDPVKGIAMYNKLIPAIKGDSVRYNKAGYNLQGWQEDFYDSGKLLHKGFYVDGQIKIFKNYYETGQVERSLNVSDPMRCSLDIYYPDGKVRSQVMFYDGNAQKEYYFFPNGNPEKIFESDKDRELIYKNNSYYANGQQASALELVDKKARKYSKKEFYNNGKLKEEGVYVLSDSDYQKDGEWIYYDDNGAILKKEKFRNGKKE